MPDRSTASEFEIGVIRTAAPRYDVAILGGGLAGLTLSIQLKQARPQTSVLVLEKREGPAPEAAFKVGESTVPSGAHYFAEVVGMKDHLQEAHVRKNGLRYFLPSNGNTDITQRVEVGAPDYPPHDNFQIDRGRFENELAARARAAGVDLLQGCRVGEVTFGDDVHTVAFTHLDQDQTVEARWVVDAAGRASLLKRKLDIGREVGHHINSAWLRLGGGLDLEQWGSHDDVWLSRMSRPGIRQFSTNHLMGEGYWVWLIPLGSGSISIGVCADPRYHPYEEINDLDKLLSWFDQHEPQLAASIRPRVGEIQDFLRVRDFAFGVERVFSPDRWCLVGEAGAFADPFYSPGSDMIGFGNVFTTDLITRDLDGEDVSERIEHHNDYFLRTFETVLARTEDQYPVFGNPWVMYPKIGWDAVFQHSGTVLLMLKDKLADLDFIKSVRPDVDALYKLNNRMQRFFIEWNELEKRGWSTQVSVDRPVLPIIEAVQAIVQPLDDDGLRARLTRQREMMEAMAVAYQHKAAATALSRPLDPERPVNPYAVSLRPDAWEEEGLFDEPGWKLGDALQIAVGVNQLWLDQEVPGPVTQAEPA